MSVCAKKRERKVSFSFILYINEYWSKKIFLDIANVFLKIPLHVILWKFPPQGDQSDCPQKSVGYIFSININIENSCNISTSPTTSTYCRGRDKFIIFIYWWIYSYNIYIKEFNSSNLGLDNNPSTNVNPSQRTQIIENFFCFDELSFNTKDEAKPIPKIQYKVRAI